MNRITAACFVSLLSAFLSLTPACTADTPATDSGRSIRIIYTNDTTGYLEPCGCGGSYQGGLARRATLVSRLVRENPNALLVDSGNLSDKASTLPLVVKLMADMHYDAVGIGEIDSGFADDYFRVTAACGLKVVETANTGARRTERCLVKKIHGIRVGVVSFGKAPDTGAGIKDEVRRSFSIAYRLARKRSDVLILLDQGGIATKEWIEGEAVELGAPDIVIGGLSNSIMPREQIVGKTHIVPTSVQGKLIGVIDMGVTQGQPSSFAVRMVPVDRSVPEDEKVKRQISGFSPGQT